MTPSMSVEQKSRPTAEAAARSPGFDLAGLLGDGTARASDDGRRRVLAGPAFPADATPQVCVAAWHGVLHWLSHHDEPATTCLVGRRAHAGWPIVTRVDAQTSLAELLADVSVQWPQQHQDWPDLRDPDHSELLEPLRCHAIRLEAGSEDKTPEFALVNDGGSWRSVCAGARYSAAYQQSLMALWHRFIVALIEHPQALLSEQTHGDEVSVDMAGPVVPIAGSLARSLAARAAATPDKAAVVDDHGSIGFAELDALSDAWGQVLRGVGVRGGDHVGLAFGRSRGRSMVAAQLAVLKAGAAFVPMDADQPAARLQAMADDTDMRVALADAASAPQLQQALPGVHCLVADGLRTMPREAAEVVAAAGIDDPAYVIFTSGSTGKPKGVKVSHGNLLNFVMHLGQLLDADDVVSQFAPFTFDASVAEIHASVLNGNTLVILTGELINDPDRLQAHMSEQGVTFAAFPPQYAQHLSPAKLPGLKTLITAGSAPDHALVARWQPQLRYINAYGPTETTILSTAWQPSRVPGLHEPIVIGTPISNTRVRVANRFNQALPPGVIGELLIGGEGVTHGYIKRDALTRERFVTLAGTRWYRSGDLACLDADGRLVFSGRVDSQIKLRGHRLEPGEVETALLAIDGIRQAAVAVSDDGAAAKQLVAFCVGTPVPEEVLRQRLLQLLPAWALPNRIVWIERLPLTRNGKTDYAGLLESLAQAKAQASAEAADAVDHADELEAQVAAIWRGVLQQPRILAEDSFIHLGGDSLTALVVTSAVRRLGYAVSSAQLLQHPRLADYAQLLRAQGRSSVEPDYTSRQGAAPLAPIQGWFFSLGLTHPGTFCQSLVFETDAPIDVDRLARAFERLAGYHDQLRARFVPDTQAVAGWRQEILPEPMRLATPNVIEIADSLLDATSEACCRRLAAELQIDAAPLFRLAVCSSPRRSRVVWVVHHLLVDTVSHGVLLDDLHQLYRNPEQDLKQVLPGKSVAYGDWAGRLQQQVADDSQQLLALWRPVLAAVGQAQPLPLAQQRVASAPVVVCEARLSRDETKRLVEDATQCFRQSPEELVLAATYRALARAFDLQRIAIDVEWHGRDEAFAGSQGMDRTVGWFTSVHPLCTAVPPLDQALGPWLMALKESRAAIPRRGREFYALRYLSRDPAVQAEFAGYRQPDVLFNFSGVVQRSHGAWRTVPIAAIEMGEGNANPYAMSVETEIRDGELIVSCYSRPELWPAGAVQRLALALPVGLHEVLRHCCDKSHRRWTPSDFPQLALSQAQVDRLPATVESACALTDMQWTMLRHQHVYQVHMCYRIPRAFGETAWREAVTEWVARHDCLRTCIQEWDDGDACQVVRQSVPPPLIVHYMAAGAGERFAQALLEKARAVPVRLDLAPLFSMDVVDDGGDGFLVLLSIHHIVHDGWTIELLLNDLLQRYRHRRGEAVALPAGPLAGMADIVARQRRLRADADCRAYFAGLPWAPTACQLPARTQLKAAADAAGMPGTRLHLGTLAPELIAAVRAAAHQRGVTVNSLWLAGYVGLLRYLGGQSQVRCGVVQNGRMEDIPGVETVTGCCVNTLPLVLDVPATATFGAIAAAVAAQLERMRAAAAFPLSVIHDAVKPLLEDEMLGTLFNIEGGRYGSAQELRPTLVGGYEATNHAFTFSLIERERAAYDVRIGYDAERYDADTVARWLEIYASCMQALVSCPDEPWHQLQLLPAAQRRRVVAEWNDTRSDYPHERCAHELFEQQVEQRPDAIAVDFEGEQLSYARLNARANQLAHHLRALGVGPDTRVALCVERSLEMVVAILATLKAGGAYVPLDPAYPAERLAHMLRDSAPVLLLTQAGLRGRIEAGEGCPVVVLDEARWQQCAWAREPESNLSAQAIGLNPSHLAYVIYTSGSTGLPKGVMVEHRGWCSLATWQGPALQIGPASRVLQFSSLSFDAFAWELAMALLQGASLHIPASSLQVTGSALASFAQQHRITHATIPPVVLMASSLDATALASVQTLITAGEACSAALVQRWGAGRRLFNAYGPTESTVCATAYECKTSDAGAPPIGRPIANTQIYILDPHRRPVPIGVAGELYIGGDGVARGYLNRPELSAERFVADPFSSEPARRMYKTGDLARWLADGNIEFLGRIDHQVKVRGFRIELEEIEAQLLQVAGVREAVVLAREDSGDKGLVAYVVGDDESVKPAALRARLSQRLPEYMLPSAFVALPSLPLTPNGKLDRKALPAPRGDAFVQRAYDAPVGKIEQMLARLWSEMLGVERVGRNDHFFELGGHSLLASQLVSQLRQQLGIALTLSALFARPRLRDLARDVAEAAQSKLGAIAPIDRGAALPLSLAQQRLWVISQMDPEAGAAYHMPGALRLRGALDESALRATLERIVERHEALRTRFVSVDGRSQAVIDPPSGFALIREDLSGADAEQLELACRIEAAQPFDLATGPLIRGRLLRLADDDHVLLVTLHHIVSDGWSVGVLMREMSSLYAAYSQGRPDPLPPLSIQYADYAAWQREWLQGPLLQQQLQHWVQHLQGAPALVSLPTDRPRPERGDHAGAGIDIELDASLTQEIKALGRRHGTTLYMTLLAAWAAVVARLAGQQQVVIGSPVANRSRAEVEPLIGFFVNTLALKVDLTDRPSVKELLAQVKRTVVQAQEHQDVPFEQVVDALKPARSLAHSPLFQLMLAWQNTPEARLELGELSVETLSPQQHGEMFDLTLNLQETDKCIVGSLSYATALFDEATVRRHWGYVQAMLQGMVREDSQASDGIELLTPQERHQVLHAFNDTRRDYASEALIHELFERQVQQRPNATAVQFEREQLSYAEINARANQLAHHLRGLGVGPDVRVAICVERGMEMMIALLATLKAGGAYVPLDPAYPGERLSYMLSDSAPVALLTQDRLLGRVEAGEGCAVVVLDQGPWEQCPWAGAPECNPSGACVGLSSSHLAYVIYTSGSTGLPKGVCIPHRTVVNFLQDLQRELQFTSADRLLAITTLSFDIAVLELFLPLHAGARVVVASREQAMDGAQLKALLQDCEANVMQATPATWRMLIEAGFEGHSSFKGLCGGEALSPDLAQQLQRRCGRLWNMYGPTETTVWSACSQVKPGRPITIGGPIANTRIYLLDAHHQPVPVGVAGELCIAGAGVARGYLNRPELTAERFVADPFSSETGVRMYKTGDLGRWLADGSIEFLGRNDFQVKIRGFRIELGEIEAKLAQLPGIRQAVVMARETNPGGKRLVAYVVGDAADPAALRTQLSAGLPDYMVPAAFVVLDAMPQTANGKTDRARLPAPDASAYAHGIHCEPETAAERTLWNVWREVLGIDSFGVTDGFYAIGGDSILAIEMVAKARKQGLALTPRLVVEEETIRKLVGRLTSAPAAQAAPAPVPSLPPAGRPVRGQQRLLPGQLRFLHDDVVDVDRSCQYTLVALPQEITHDMLRSALAALVARHDVLRLKFRQTAGGWIATYRPELLAATPGMLEAFFDATEPAEFDAGIHVAPMLAQLDIRQGRLFGWRMVLQGGERRLLWVMHRLVVDEASWRLLTADLAAALAQLVRGEPVALEARPDSCQDWAARLHDYAYSPALEQERAYWTGQLAQSSARLHFDIGGAGDGVQPLEATTAMTEACLGADETRLLLEQADARYAMGPQQLLVAAVGRTLGDWLAADAVRIDLEGHGRENLQDVDLFDGLDASRTVGALTTLCPLHLDDLRADIGTQLRRTKVQLESVPHNGLGCDVLRLLAQDEELASGDQPASEVLFRHVGELDAMTAVGSEVSPRRRRTHALRIEGVVRDGVLSLRLDYSREQFEPGTIAALAERCLRALREIAASCTATGNAGESHAFALAGLAPDGIGALQARYPGCKDIYACTAMQQGLLLFSARSPQSGLYLMQLRIELEGADPARLRHSWQVLIERHDVLRSAFVDGGQASLLQVVCPHAELPWRETDGRTLPDANALERLLDEERTLPFDVAAAPLMRVLLVRTSDERHCMAWTHHHALLDGWSMGLLIKELFEIYAGSEPVGSLRSTWRPYVEWLRSRDRAAAERYWQTYFDGIDIAAGASLPHARLRADEPVSPRRYEQALQTLVLPAEATARLTRLARAEGVSLGTLMFAAWGLLLSKYNAEPEVLFGYASSGRSPELAGSESLVGLCINSLPLRLKIDADQKLGAWLKDIQRRQMDHEDHGHLALAEIQRCGGVRPGQALFDSLVAVENFPLDSSLLSTTANIPRIVAIEGAGQSDFALNLVVHPGERLKLDLAYQTALFDPATIATLLRRLEQLLASLAKGGAQTLAQLSLLSPADHERAVRQWNDTAVAYPHDRALPALFEAMARRREVAPAIVCGDATWTYGQLDERVRVLSAWLARSGVSAGAHVALSLRKEPALLAAMLAVMRLGAAYVPIALDCPPERRAFLLADADIRCTLTHRSERGALPDDKLLCIEDCPADFDHADLRAIDVDPQATAYVIYTSGSTGTPKGVAISHRNLVNFCAWCTHAGLVQPGERTTQFAPYTFDASAGEVFAGLLAGAELHLLGDALIQDPRMLAQYLSAHDIRFAAFPPTYLQQMDPALVPPQLVLLTAGSAPTQELVQRWGARCRYINGYGPTETTILSSAWICERGAVEGRKLSIGRPISNTRMYVVDRCGQLCAPGLIGEICIGGDGVAQGYLNRPELTERQFVTDPWVDGGRMYRTGDHGRWLDDGSIEFIGRRDRQVKLRGYRIELNEIEKHIRAHADVRDAAVLVRDSGGEQRLLAWVVPAQAPADEEAFIASVRESMQRSVPDYMLPQAILCMAQLPLTAHGKLDEKALPEPATLTAIGSEHVPPRTATEARLAAIWAAVLQLRTEQVGATSDFFALGGHSLMAMRAIARVREELGADVDVSELFARPVLADLAVAVDAAARAHLPPIVPTPRDVPPPLSYAQQRLWFLAQMEGVSATYNIPGALRLCGRLDRAALRRALDRIVERHETLRTTFVTVGGEPRQHIAEAATFALHEHDLRGWADADERLAQLMREEAVAAFDLAAGPLIRGRLMQLHDDEHVLQITMHHIVMDAWSLGLMLKELGALYGAYAAGGDDPLPALAVQYADYAAWQQQWLAGNPWQEQSEYWRRTLAGAPRLLELPADRPRPAQQDYAGDHVELAFDAGLTAGLKALGRRHGTTLFTTLLAVWSVVLSKLSGQQELVIGSPVANRAQLETEPLIGFFINTLALRVDLSGNPTLGELLQRVKRQVLDGQRYQQLPFEQVVEIVQPPRSLGHTPVFQVMFNWQDQGLGDFALDGLEATPLRAPYPLSKFDLTLDLSEAGDTIVGGLEYATALFDAATIRRQAGYLQRVVAAIVADADQRVQSLDLLGPDEHRLLDVCNDTRRPELVEHSWPELFDAQAARTPERIAVRCGSAQLSYRELHERATRLAMALVAHGAGPGKIIGLLDERGIDLHVMIVAVLKAGAAYMPLDPVHPAQRWLDVLHEAQPLLLWVGDGLAAEQRWLRRKWTAGEVSGTADLLAEAAPTVLPTPALDDLAYVLFTSGSTGKPKGVMIEHRGMVNNMRSKFEPLALGADDVIAQTASQCFDISVWQFLTALLLGAKVLIVGNELTRDPQALLDHLAAERASVWEPVPSVMQAALPWRKPLPCLRWVMPTGEALSRELVARWFEQYPGIPLMNAYGPAECSDDVAFQPLRGPVERVLIGKPVANAQLHVVDDNLMRLPLGAVGELAVSGPVVGRGYLARPDETQAAFRTNPFARDAVDQRLYLTGDLARRWPDGSLEFIGRKDFQLKIRGFRIELGEIESCLAQHPAVREAVVDARELGQGDRQLVAYVTLDGNAAGDALQAHLRARLPDYMVPAAIVVLDALPLNANGKVDRKALPEPTPAALARADYEAPCSATERTIAALWQELLQVPQVGRGDSYFDLGGSSLLLIRMLSRLKDHGMSLGVTDVYQLRTVRACAEAIDAQRSDAALWPLDGRWKHAIVTVGEGPSRRTALLLDRSETGRREELQRLLGTVDPAARPHFVRTTDDIDGLSQRIAEVGVAALAPATDNAAPRGVVADAVRRLMSVLVPAHGSAALVDALRTQLRHYRQRLADAPTETTLRFSPIQRNLMAWQERDNLDIVALDGWYCAAELQRAFGAVAAEQDMLRAAQVGAQPQWRLLAADAIAAAPIPVVDLSGEDPARVDELMQRIGAELLAARKKAPLAYVAAVVTLTDLEHRLLLAVDHLIWDGVSAAVLQRRLKERLRGVATPVLRNYRDHVDATWRMPDEKDAALLRGAIDRADLAATMDATRQALARRANLPLQVVELRLPGHFEGDAADRMFGCFKQCVAHLTGLARYGVVLNHHGRESGAERWFDQVGLFLDKVPFAADADTPLEQLAARAAWLQKQGINHVGLAQVASAQWGSTLPPLAYEVQFNFQTAAPEQSTQTAGGRVMDKLKDFRGIAFEAAAGDGGMRVGCAFRGNAADVEAVRRIVAASKPLEPVAPACASESVYSLEVRDVHKRYGDFEAVKGVSFSVRRGTCFGILGPNGAGKTSLLAMIEGLIPITSGSISLLGMDVASEIHRIQPHVGVQLQQNNYFQFLTVAQLLKFYQKLRAAVGGKRSGRSVDSLLERLDLKDKLGFKVDELSGGQKQRLSIAIALLEDPDVIFLDEPTSALDPHSRVSTWEFLEDLKKDPSKTIILTTHYMEEAERLCDEILLMDRGRVIAQGNPLQLAKSLGANHSIQVQFGRGQFRPDLLGSIVDTQDARWDEKADCLHLRTRRVTDTLREVLAMSQAASIDVVNFDISRPTLEDVFLSHTNKALVP